MYNYSDPITIKFSDELFYELAMWGYIAFDFTNGYIWNMVTRRPMGHVNNHGYVAIAWKYHGKAVHALAHRILWACNHHPIPDGMQINHINGIKSDNRDVNLELVTASQNMQHAVATGLVNFSGLSIGVQNYYLNNLNSRAKLTPDQVRYVRSRYALGGRENSMRAIARDLGVDHKAISKIISGENYKSVR